MLQAFVSDDHTLGGSCPPNKDYALDTAMAGGPDGTPLAQSDRSRWPFLALLRRVSWVNVSPVPAS